MVDFAAAFNFSRPCTRCEGTGTRVDAPTSWAGAIAHHAGQKVVRACVFCKGRGRWMAPDTGAILDEIISARTRRPRARLASDASNRAAYVFAWWRFHSGRNVNLGGLHIAGFRVAGDPYVPELDGLAAAMCERLVGESRGAARWRRALGVDA